MISVEECQKIIDIALKQARGKADGAEIQIIESDVATSRFANNSMTQNQSPNCVSVSARVLVNGRQARLSTDRIGADDITKLIDDACAVAKLLEKDADLLPLYDGKETNKEQAVNRFDKATATLGPEARAQAVAEIVEEAKSRNILSAGTVFSGQSTSALGNSQGLFCYHAGSHCGASITMNNNGATGWAKYESPEFADLDVAAMAKRTAEKSLAAASPQEIEPGHYTVIFEPSATLDFMFYLWPDFAATSYKDKLSCLLGKLDQKMFGANIHVVDDAYHPLQWGEQFDGEGVPRKKVTLIDNGVVKNLVYGRRAAKEFREEPTGHGLPEPNSAGEQPQNIVMRGGDSSLEKMISSTERGILLTRVWYVREVDATKKIITGMTRDGTFLVEDGKIKNSVFNLRFNESIIDCLNRVVELGPAVRAAGEEGLPSVVPAMKISGFNFDSVTKF